MPEPLLNLKETMENRVGATDPKTHTHAAADITGLGGAATKNVGTVAGTVAAGDDSRLVDNEKTTNKTSDLFADAADVVKYPTAKAVADYVSNAVTGLLEFKGNYAVRQSITPLDQGGNPMAPQMIDCRLYPAGQKGDTYFISADGNLGGTYFNNPGSSGPNFDGTDVYVGDTLVCKADNAGGTHAAVGSSWFILSRQDYTGVMFGSNNLSDVDDVSQARINLGLKYGVVFDDTHVRASTVSVVTDSSGVTLGYRATINGAWTGDYLLISPNGYLTRYDSNNNVVEGVFMSGGVGQVSGNLIANGGVGFAKLPQIGALTILGNSTGAAGTVTELTGAQARQAIGLGNVVNTDTTNASNISSGTLPNARLNSSVTGTYGNLTFTNGLVTNIQAGTTIGFTIGNLADALDQVAVGTTAQYLRGNGTLATLDKTAVGLGNVANVDTTNASNISSGTLAADRLPGWTILSTASSNYTLLASDAGKKMKVIDSSAGAVTVSPPASPVAGQEFFIKRTGANTVNLATQFAAAGITLNWEGFTGPTGIANNRTIQLIFTSATTADVYGGWE